MSLGWMNLQDYLAVNRESADDMAYKLDEYQRGVDADIGRDSNKPVDTVPYGQFLERQRTAQRMRDSDEGRAAILGGSAADAFLAGKGQSNYQRMELDRNAIAQRNRQHAAEADYWRKQTERNQRLQSEAADARRRQDEGFTAAKKAMEDRAGGPGYAGYSRAAEKSREAARGKQVRVISDEEWNKWTR